MPDETKPRWDAIGNGPSPVRLLERAGLLVSGAERPLLILPATLVMKTQSDFFAAHAARSGDAGRNPTLPTFVRLMSIEKLGRPDAYAELEGYAPDVIVAYTYRRLLSRQRAAEHLALYLKKHRRVILIARD